MTRGKKVIQLAEQLRLQLRDTPYSNAPFKSARQTAAEFGVSRQTADRALRLLAEEGALTRIPGAGTWQRGSYKRRLRIACMIDRQHSMHPSTPYSDLPMKHQLLLDELEAASCDVEFFSFYELRKANFSSRIFDGFDGLIADFAYCDLHSRQLVCEFKGAKVWFGSAVPMLEPASQVIVDFLSGFIELFHQARKSGIRKFRVHLARPQFREMITRAMELTGIEPDSFQVFERPEIFTQLPAYKYGLQLPHSADTLDVCDLDISACGIYEAFIDRNLVPGEFALSGIGNIESLGFLPFNTPQITTVATPRQEISRAIVDCVLKQIRHPQEISHIVKVPAPVIFRASAFGDTPQTVIH